MKIALVFDFDDTLCHDSTSAFLEYYGVNVQQFWNEKVAKLIDDGWDPIPAYMYQLIEESKKVPITKNLFKDFGNALPLHKGLDTFVKNLKHFIYPLYPDKKIELEFFIISSGIYDIVASCSLTYDIKQIWASQFHYNNKQEIEFPKQIISFTDKTRYLFYIQKGLLGDEFLNKPFEVNTLVKDVYIPFNQFIYVGDGYTDVPCFSLISKAGGKTFAVYDNEKPDSQKRAWGFLNDKRVSQIFEPNYEIGSELYNEILGSLMEIIDGKPLIRHLNS